MKVYDEVPMLRDANNQSKSKTNSQESSELSYTQIDISQMKYLDLLYIY